MIWVKDGKGFYLFKKKDEFWYLDIQIHHGCEEKKNGSIQLMGFSQRNLVPQFPMTTGSRFRKKMYLSVLVMPIPGPSIMSGRLTR